MADESNIKPPVQADAEGQNTAQANGRRKFLRDAVTMGSAAMVGGSLAKQAAAAPAAKVALDPNLPPGVPQWSKVIGAPILTHPYGIPSTYEKNVIRREIPGLTRTRQSSVAFAPLQDMVGIITPNGVHFERDHGGVPTINPAEHRLMIHGLVKKPLLLTMDDIKRFPSVSRIHFIECGANSAIEWGAAVGETVQFTHGMISCAEWTGVPLSVLLKEAGVSPKGKWLLVEGADAAATTRSLPLEKAMDDVIVAYGQNGEMLRPENGYPLRLVVPGWQGIINTKWLRRIKVGDAPWMTREETSQYTDLQPNGKAFGLDPVQLAKSVITFPSAGQKLNAHGFYEIRGLAWSGNGKVKHVDVSVDGGRNWMRAELQEPVMSKCLTRFRLPWYWDGKPALLQSRCTDETDYTQPTMKELVAVRGTRSIYHNNGIHTWKLAPNGEVTNVYYL
jgi:sulfane dehydrogenase subunit SoxC